LRKRGSKNIRNTRDKIEKVNDEEFRNRVQSTLMYELILAEYASATLSKVEFIAVGNHMTGTD
jgi:hypothetical protein